jgi:hypothetical protein
MWRSAAGALATIIDVPPRSRLWYDDRDISFLQEDRDAAATILSTRVATVVSAVNGGFTPDSSVAAVENEDLSLLVHSGLVSVQLLPPGTEAEPDEPEPEPDDDDDDETPDPDSNGSGESGGRMTRFTPAIPAG